MININPYISTVIVLEYLKIVKDYYQRPNKKFSDSELIGNLVSQISDITKNSAYLEINKDNNIIKYFEQIISDKSSEIIDDNLYSVKKLVKIKKEYNDIIDLVKMESGEQIKSHNIQKSSPPVEIMRDRSVTIIENPYCRRSNRVRKKAQYYGYN